MSDGNRSQRLIDAMNLIAEACLELPDEWEIVLRFGSQESCFELYDPECDEREVHPDGQSVILSAIEFARGEEGGGK